MFFPPIRENEFLSGYRGRLAATNELNSANKLNLALKRRLDTINHERSDHGTYDLLPSKVDFVELLAANVGVAAKKLLFTHGLGGLSLAFRPINGSENDVVGPKFISPLTRLRNSKVWLCMDCIESDLASRQLSFWRRDHQVPGHYRCATHGCILRFIDCPLLLNKHPHEVSHLAQAPDSILIAHSDNSQSARITADFLSLLSLGSRVRCRRSARMALLDRAKLFCETTSSWIASGQLRNSIIEGNPSAWLTDINSQTNSAKKCNNFVQFIIETDHLHAAGAYALIVGHLFTSISDVVCAIGLEQAPLEDTPATTHFTAQTLGESSNT
jgi:hypothetical protein